MKMSFFAVYALISTLILIPCSQINDLYNANIVNQMHLSKYFIICINVYEIYHNTHAHVATINILISLKNCWFNHHLIDRVLYV